MSGIRARSAAGARPAILALGLIALQGSGAVAQRAAELGKEKPYVLQSWRETLEESDRLLREGEWKRVRRRASRLLAEMVERIESGAAAAQYLASAALQRAIAEAGLGNDRDAAWDYEMALALHDDFAELDLGAYGEGGERLARYRDLRFSEGGHAGSFGVEPPRKLRGPRPGYPRAKRIACLEEAIVVESVIDTDGRLKRPRLLTASYPVLGFAAMDVLREWRFEPARFGGRAVPVIYNLTVNYDLTLCHNLTAIRARERDRGEDGDPPAEEAPPPD